MMFAQALPKTKSVPMFVFLLHARECMLNKLYGYDLAISDRFGSLAVIQLLNECYKFSQITPRGLIGI